MNVAYQSKAELRQFYEDIFEKRTYLRHGITLSPGATVFDVGANIGLFTVFVDHHYPNSRVFAFEPAPPLFKILEANTAWCMGEVLLFECGLGASAEEAELTFYPWSSGMSTFHPDSEDERATLRTVMRNELTQRGPEVEAVLRHEEDLLNQRFLAEIWRCPIRTLSEIIVEHAVDRIDLLKVDVEKSEAEVLSGITEVDWRKVRQAVVEVHDLGERVRELTELFRYHGFCVRVEQEELYRGSDRYNLYAARVSASS
jgi:FkbM family methyltransferase